MTSWLVARLRIEWPGGHCVVFLGKTLNFTLSTQVYKLVRANLMLRITLQWPSISSGGGGV